MYILEDKIVEKALSYKGEVEIPQNKGFKNPVFDKLMRFIGFISGHAWCMYFVRLIWVETYRELGALDLVKKYTKLISPSAVQTWKNFKKAEHPMCNIPRKGSIAIWQTYKNGIPSYTGHGAIIVETAGTYMQTSEGNTSKYFGDRDGGSVWVKDYHNYEEMFNIKNGLRLLGFIHLKEYTTDEELKKLPASEY